MSIKTVSSWSIAKVIMCFVKLMNKIRYMLFGTILLMVSLLVIVYKIQLIHKLIELLQLTTLVSQMVLIVSQFSLPLFGTISTDPKCFILSHVWV